MPKPQHAQQITLAVQCAPSRSRPQMPTAEVTADAHAAKSRLGGLGVVGFTEIVRPGPRIAIRRTFPTSFVPDAADTPIGVIGGRIIDSGVDFGCPRIRFVAPVRHTAWALVEVTTPAGTARVGVLATHMHPGGWAARPSFRQRMTRPLIRRYWSQHAAHIAARADDLAKRATAVVTLGDINRPGALTLRGDTRLSTPGLVYIGVRGHFAHGGHLRHALQHADHDAQVAYITIPAQ